jgi:hypothetical protein
MTQGHNPSLQGAKRRGNLLPNSTGLLRQPICCLSMKHHGFLAHIPKNEQVFLVLLPTTPSTLHQYLDTQPNTVLVLYLPDGEIMVNLS